jgi:DNA-binding XRE family transcriptional regulator
LNWNLTLFSAGVHLAEALGVSQQTMQCYEVGRRRIPVSALPTMAQALGEVFSSKQTRAPTMACLPEM